jgi:hypothetical protein
MKTRLLASVGAAALALALTGPAHSFSTIDWDWYKNKTSNIEVNKWIWAYFHPTGETEVEKLQVYIGDVKASAELKGDYVPQTLSIEGGTIEVPVTLPFSGSAEFDSVAYTGEDPRLFGPVDSTGVSGDVASASGSGTVLYGNNTLTFTVDVDGTVSGMATVEVEPLVQDLTQTASAGLGHAIQDVTASGLVDSIDSEFAVDAHETQILFGGNDLDAWDVYANGFFGPTGFIALMAEFIEPAKVEAKAKAGSWWNPVQIAVQQDVSAVAEALLINLESNTAPAVILTANEDNGYDAEGNPYGPDSFIDTYDTVDNSESDWCHWCSKGGPKALSVFYPVATDNILEADITQFAYANTYAKAEAYQDLTAFTGLGSYSRLTDADGNAVRGLVANQTVSAAGLVGNIVNKVSVPVTPTP